MIFRVAIPLLLLPLLAVTLPLMFALAWLHEALSDLAPARNAPDEVIRIGYYFIKETMRSIGQH
jgi:hypothetical protein